MPPPFTPGQPVRLLVAYLAWRHRAGTCWQRPDPTAAQRCPNGPTCRMLSPKEPLRFLGCVPERDGACLVVDAEDRAWVCPLGFLATGDP
jgi:hypothetical protein